VVVQEKVKAGGLLSYRGLYLVGVMSAPDRPGIAAAIFQTLNEEHLNAQFIVQNIDLNNDAHVQFCVSQEDCVRVLASLKPVASRLGAQKVTERGPVALVSVFGPDFRERPGIAGTAFSALAQVGINILAVSTSISTISCVINETDCDPAITALKNVFALP
jgi:aspartate kinase